MRVKRRLKEGGRTLRLDDRRDMEMLGRATRGGGLGFGLGCGLLWGVIGGCRCCSLLETAQVANFLRICVWIRWLADSQIGGAAFFGLVVVGAGDAEGDAMSARCLWILCVFASTADLAGSAGVAACGYRVSGWADSELPSITYSVIAS